MKTASNPFGRSCSDYFFNTAFSTVSLSIFFVQKNQSYALNPSSFPSIRSSAVPHDPAGGTITSSPGRQSAGVAYIKFICGLQCNKHPVKLVEIPSQTERIIDDGPDHSLRDPQRILP